MGIITISGEVGSQRNALAQEICARGRLELVDRHTLMEAVQGLVDLSRDEHQLLAEQGPAMLDLSSRRRRVFTALLELVMLQYAQTGQAVVVGRGANFLLRLVPGVLRVRTVAPLDLRAQRLAAEQNMDLERARQLATVVDQQRRTYVAHLFGADWASPLNYDLVLNMGRLSLEQAALTVLDLASHDDFEPSAESRRLIEGLVLAARARRHLVEELDIHALEIDAVDGVLSLAGYVASYEEAKRARALAEEVQGVERVESAIEVSPTLMKFLP
ncbi:MAG: cytidylate kinase family protein [Desulfarculus sp.]|nr:cytidylate kinase family protein [Desulfarculus sp.]